MPQVVVEHDPPRQSPTDTRHPVDDPVRSSSMSRPSTNSWDCGATPTTVIEHGVKVPEDANYTGHLARGVSVINDLQARGRRLGADVFARARERVLLDLVGMASERIGGLGEVRPDLPGLPGRLPLLLPSSALHELGLSPCEAMSVGLPVVGSLLTELPNIDDGVNGFVDTDPEQLVEVMHALLADPELARAVGEAGRATARERFLDRPLRAGLGCPPPHRLRVHGAVAPAAAEHQFSAGRRPG